ncbi:hypothetical protein SanaruYs_13240 [Chryseotalea sanaruensis]|jgi:hypothetical protein|uniref:LiaF transmembrane domain-containing protein n=1 Tax=Chryseotalea sanaruensis TaxID=2482724 RepID=A0A401U891_9BACT|nr:DUF5668 domain-containing protein [Chryseotalea sanaruensis]GCC51104.1 hypothetical protein SanaruYs_13240 [Chryseotalea sanaruensis]
MEAYDKGVKPTPSTPNQNNNGRIWGGLIVVVIGVVLLAREMNLDLPEWLFTWKMLVIGIGLYVGAKNSFKPGGWMIAVLVGIVFIVDDYVYDVNLRPYLIPAIVIGIGLYLIFKPKSRAGQYWNEHTQTHSGTDGNWESVSIFGGNKNIISKDFKGGEMVTIFGGSEVNMSQADISGVVTLEVVQIFGGTKLIVPANWKVQTSEVVSILGGIDDKRPAPTNVDETKVLNIRGTSVFGGIDIRSY